MDNYKFSPQEQAFFSRKIQDLNVIQTALQQTVSLVIEQQGLQGTWRISQDGNGLEPVDTTTKANIPSAAPGSDATTVN